MELIAVSLSERWIEMRVGIEAINFYSAQAYIRVKNIFKGRKLNLDRFDNLMMESKSNGLPCEDPVSLGVNAAKSILDKMSREEIDKIELLITSTESGLDFGKAIATYIHKYLGLNRNCRLFEVKQACFGGTAAFHMASTFIASNVSPGAKALVIASDISRAAVKNTYAETSQAAGAIAMLISNKPDVFELDFGANGNYSYEVNDTCRPLPDTETGDSDLSLLSYLDCLEGSYRTYISKVEDVDYTKTFDYLAFHTPFAGIVKGGHRKMMREFSNYSAVDIEKDFENRVRPSLKFCAMVGNVYSATLYLALCGLIDSVDPSEMRRIGLFSYGSGCCSEFYSGTFTSKSKEIVRAMDIDGMIQRRYELNMEEYDKLLDLNIEWFFGIKDKMVDNTPYQDIYDKVYKGQKKLVFTGVENYHRLYEWS